MCVGAHDEAGFVSRAGDKLAHALRAFGVCPAGWVCADLGCSTGGFTDCLLRNGAARVYAVDRGYGVLDYRLRADPRVRVRERTDALCLHLPEPVRLVTLDCGWTRQAMILPAARRLLGPEGWIIALVKPHYEADPSQLRAGVLPDDLSEGVMAGLRDLPAAIGLERLGECESPIRGSGGNREFLWWLGPAGPAR
jgi:23S rRNA (cytidine1920-2'-O)/16S rRNA (cytidine1409-2'-O)-methyltransferase